MSTKHFVAALSAVATLAVMPAQAATVSIETQTLTPRMSQYGVATRIRDGVEEFYTSVGGTDLVGMQVRATFADGSSEALTWQDMSVRGNRSRGGAIGSLFSLILEPGQWTLTSNALLTSLEIDVGSGNAFFDILAGRKSGTNGDTYGSKTGTPYEVLGGDDFFGEIVATYKNSVYFKGVERGIDLYQKMHVDYSGLLGGGMLGTTLFKTDLDQLKVDGDLAPVPLPGGLPLMAAGIAALGVLRRRKS